MRLEGTLRIIKSIIRDNKMVKICLSVKWLVSLHLNRLAQMIFVIELLRKEC